MGGGLVFNNLLFTKTDKTVIVRRIDRKDLPRLTILFRAASGEIDCHLNYEDARPKAEQYVPLISFRCNSREGHLNRFFSTAEREFRKLVFKIPTVTPTWLIRRGYILALMHVENLRSAILTAAPKRRGKYGVEVGVIKTFFEDVDPSITLLHPRALSDPEVRNYPIVFAARSRGRNRVVSLRYGPIGNRPPEWTRIDASIVDEFQRLFISIFPSELKEKARSIWRTVYEAMELSEMAIVRDWRTLACVAANQCQLKDYNNTRAAPCGR